VADQVLNGISSGVAVAKKNKVPLIINGVFFALIFGALVVTGLMALKVKGYASLLAGDEKIINPEFVAKTTEEKILEIDGKYKIAGSPFLFNQITKRIHIFYLISGDFSKPWKQPASASPACL
jgi:hypothetical protein